MLVWGFLAPPPKESRESRVSHITSTQGAHADLWKRVGKEGGREREGQREKERERETERYREKDRYRKTERGRQRQIDRSPEKQRKTKTGRKKKGKVAQPRVTWKRAE